MRYALAHGIELRRSDPGRGGLLVDLVRGECFELNPSGLDAVEGLCRGEHSERVAEDLAARAGAPPAIVLGDVNTLVTQLVRAGLLVTSRS